MATTTIGLKRSPIALQKGRIEMAQVVLNWDITKASLLAFCLDASVFLWYVLSIEKGRRKMSLKNEDPKRWHILLVLSAAAVTISGLCSLALVVMLMSTPAIIVPPEFNGIYTIHILGEFENEKSAIQSIHGIDVTQHKAYFIKTGKNYHLILGEFKERREAENVLQSLLAKEQFVGAELLTPTRRWKLINL